MVSKAFFLFGFGFLRFRSASELGVFYFVDVFSMLGIFLDRTRHFLNWIFCSKVWCSDVD